MLRVQPSTGNALSGDDERRRIYSEGILTSEIQKDIERLAAKMYKAGVTPQIAVNVLVQAMQKGWQRTLIVQEGLALHRQSAT